LQVDLVLIPAVTGDFGVMPGHVPTVAQLRPGVVTVHTELDKELEKYFVSSGFAFVHADSSADVCAVEAVKVSDLDPEAIRAGLQVTFQSLPVPDNVSWCHQYYTLGYVRMDVSVLKGGKLFNTLVCAFRCLYFQVSLVSGYPAVPELPVSIYRSVFSSVL
jgi:ATP synthase, Delta/Epsilon chain, beta-sandwich domain